MCCQSFPFVEAIKLKDPPEGSSWITFVDGPLRGCMQVVPDDETFIHTTKSPEPNCFDTKPAPVLANFKYDVYRRGWGNKNEFYYIGNNIDY